MARDAFVGLESSLCSECVFWTEVVRTDGEKTGVGECHRYAPRPRIALYAPLVALAPNQTLSGPDRLLPDVGEVTAEWPQVAYDDHCGEFHWRPELNPDSGSYSDVAARIMGDRQVLMGQARIANRGTPR